MPSENIRIALVILEDREGRIALQLRSAIAQIVNPDRWGLFGGHVEADESPEQAALREVEEELTTPLQARKLRFIKHFQLPNEKDYFAFHYPVSNELDNAILTEGQRFGWFAPAQIRTQTIDGKAIVPYHYALLDEFWSNPPR